MIDLVKIYGFYILRKNIETNICWTVKDKKENKNRKQKLEIKKLEIVKNKT